MVNLVSMFLAFVTVFSMLFLASVGHQALWNGDAGWALVLFGLFSLLFVRLLVLIRYHMFFT
jgi:hypothetical protein